MGYNVYICTRVRGFENNLFGLFTGYAHLYLQSFHLAYRLVVNEEGRRVYCNTALLNQVLFQERHSIAYNDIECREKSDPPPN